MLILTMRDKRPSKELNYILDTNDYTVESLSDEEVISLYNKGIDIEGLMCYNREQKEKDVSITIDNKKNNEWVTVFAQVIIFDNYCIVNSKRYFKIYYKHKVKYLSHDFAVYDVINIIRLKSNHNTICIVLRSSNETLYKCFTYTDDDKVIDLAKPYELEESAKVKSNAPMSMTHISRGIKRTSEFDIKTKTNINIGLGTHWNYDVDFNILIKNEKDEWVRATDTGKEQTLQILCTPLLQKIERLVKELDFEIMQAPAMSQPKYNSDWFESSIITYITDYFKGCIIDYALLKERRNIVLKTGIYILNFEINTNMTTNSTYLVVSYILFDVTKKHKGNNILGRYKIC